LVRHLFGTGENAVSNQDRALAVYATTPVNDTSPRYGVEAIQSELDYYCAAPCTGPTGSPDGEATVASLQFADLATAHWTAAGDHGVVRATYSNAGTGNGATMNVFTGTFSAGKNAYTNGDEARIVNGHCNNGFATTTGLACIFYLMRYSNNVFQNGQVGIQTRPDAAFTPGSLDAIIRNDSIPGLNNYLNGPVGVNAINSTTSASVPVRASFGVVGSIKVSSAAAPTFPGQASCSGGASTYTYVYVGVDANGGTVPSASMNSNPGCTNPLTVGNPATLSALTVPARNTGNGVTEVVRIDVYRTAGPMATGKIGSVTCSAGVPSGICTAFVDTGLAADGTTPPTINTTGTIGANLYKTNTNCAASGTAANPSVVSCSAAPAGIVFCDVAASAGTCTVNTTAVTANSVISITPSAADGTLLSVTCNTAMTFGTAPILSAKVVATSFTINMPTVVTNGVCFEYSIIN
jgi:hypothetical protein